MQVFKHDCAGRLESPDAAYLRRKGVRLRLTSTWTTCLLLTLFYMLSSKRSFIFRLYCANSSVWHSKDNSAEIYGSYLMLASLSMSALVLVMLINSCDSYRNCYLQLRQCIPGFLVSYERYYLYPTSWYVYVSICILSIFLIAVYRDVEEGEGVIAVLHPCVIFPCVLIHLCLHKLHVLDIIKEVVAFTAIALLWSVAFLAIILLKIGILLVPCVLLPCVFYGAYLSNYNRTGMRRFI